MNTRTGMWTLRIVLLAFSVALFVWAAPEMSQQFGWGSDEATTNEVKTSYIIQGKDLQDISVAVHRSGGELTHSLPIINAVGANLTTEQHQALSKSKLVTRVYENRSAAVMSTGDTYEVWASQQVQVAGKKMTWEVTNTGTGRITIDRIALNWPDSNGNLKKVKLDGEEIYEYELAPSFADIVSGWQGDLMYREIEPGDTAELEFEFKDNASVYLFDYAITLEFMEGCSAEFVSDSAFGPIGGDKLFFSSKKFHWLILNASTETITIDSISTTWPVSNGQLKKVKLKGKKIYEEERMQPFTTINEDWDGSLSHRQIRPFKFVFLTLEFEYNVRRSHHDYAIEVDFAEGYSLEFVPRGAGDEGEEGDDIRSDRDTYYPTLLGADRLHLDGTDGNGVTVAVLDSGLWEDGKGLKKNTFQDERLLAQYDAIDDQYEERRSKDESGHGTHVTSVLASSRKTRNAEGDGYTGSYNGMAPNVDILSVKAFDENGMGSYLDIIRGLDFIVEYKDVFDIRVLNLSFAATPQSYYWDDPLNQAVMAAWQAGIVVVASAGNTGPDPMTIGVPGNVPYVITVGAMTDSYTPADGSDDVLATFSSTGPTVEGFVKPEVVAPGGHVLGMMDDGDEIPKNHEEFHSGDEFFIMSGTSQAAAVVSGVVALMLEDDPALTPDQVKGRLMATAQPAVDDDGDLAYSIFQQGAGLVNAYDAVHSDAMIDANSGLDIDLDLAGVEHFGGLANQDEDGDYFIMGLDGYAWNGGYLWSDGFAWNGGYLWSDGFAWSGGYLWSDLSAGGAGYLWSDTYAFDAGYLWSDGLTESASINSWVPQE